ncbi:mCG1048990, partial [Mus musculus]
GAEAEAPSVLVFLEGRSTHSTLFLLHFVTPQPWGLSIASQWLENICSFQNRSLLIEQNTRWQQRRFLEHA